MTITSMPQRAPIWVRTENIETVKDWFIKKHMQVHCKLILLIIQKVVVTVKKNKNLKADLESSSKTGLEKCVVVSDDYKKIFFCWPL